MRTLAVVMAVCLLAGGVVRAQVPDLAQQPVEAPLRVSPDQPVQRLVRLRGAQAAVHAACMRLGGETIEPGTRFATMVARRDFEPLGADASAELFELTQERTADAGLPAYEISNHAGPGEESRHNLAYWRYRDYAGIGPGAHGRRSGVFTRRHRKPENWLAALARQGHGIDEEQTLTPAEQALEALLMGLRLTEGVELARVESAIDTVAVARLADQGLLAAENERLRATGKGRLLLDSILAEIALG